MAPYLFISSHCALMKSLYLGSSFSLIGVSSITGSFDITGLMGFSLFFGFGCLYSCTLIVMIAIKIITPTIEYPNIASLIMISPFFCEFLYSPYKFYLIPVR